MIVGEITLSAPAVGAVCGSVLVREGYASYGVAFFAASLLVYALAQRRTAG